MTVPTYTKILTLGSSYTENALLGDVCLQEKVDGSQFSFGINKGEIAIRSKNAPLFEDNHAEMFREGVEYILSLKELFNKVGLDNCYFYCEYLQKEKHNTLKYDRIPKNHLVLFDCLLDGKWLDRKSLLNMGSNLNIDVIPEYHFGLTNVDMIKEMLNKESYLGGAKIEGVVIKNYNQTVLIGGKVFPLFTKFVSEEFKEKHMVDWKIRQPKSTLQDYIKGFNNQARWQKSIIHMKEQGLLTNSPKDIGPLIKMIQKDIFEEETENIKNFLFKSFKDDIERESIKNFPQWYKEKLLENLNEN